MKALTCLIGPMMVWVFLGQFVAGLFFTQIYAEHPATIPLVMMAGFAVGRLSELVMDMMIARFMKKEGKK